MSNSIYMINGNSFQVVKRPDTNKPTLAIKQRHGTTLILFYSTTCQYCHEMMNKFEELSTIISNCVFATCNIGDNMEVAEQSQYTDTPITYVPLLVLYINGLPYVRFNGDEDVPTLRDIITKTTNELTHQISSASASPAQQQERANRPYDGNPLRGKKMKNKCYIKFGGM